MLQVQDRQADIMATKEATITITGMVTFAEGIGIIGVLTGIGGIVGGDQHGC
jgi:hypothetical protein